MKLLSGTFLLFFVIGCSMSSVIRLKYTFDELVKILNGMPENEKLQFLQHHIRLGHSLTVDQDQMINMKPNLPEDFSIYLYNYAKKFKITDQKLLKQLREVVCFEDGACIDMGDIGVHP